MIMNTYNNNPAIDQALENVNLAYHMNVSELLDFGVRQVTSDRYVLYNLTYNGYNEPVETDITVPISEKLLLGTLNGLAKEYYNR